MLDEIEAKLSSVKRPGATYSIERTELAELLARCRAAEQALASARAMAGRAEQRELPARMTWLQARARYIHEMVAEGSSFEEIVRVFAMDPGQVQLISMTPLPLFPPVPEAR